MRGNFTVKIGDSTFSRIISRYGTIQDLTVNDLLPDDYEVIVTYNGDNNYNAYSNTTTFSVFEYPEPQVSNEGQDTQNSHKSAYETISNGKVLFEIQLNSNITGSIVIDAGGKGYMVILSSILASLRGEVSSDADTAPRSYEESDVFTQSGPAAQVKERYGLSGRHVAEAVLRNR